MISVEIRVNGSLIATAGVVNRGPAGVLQEYEVQSVLMPLDNRGPADSRHFKVHHNRDDGALSLIHNVIERMMENPCLPTRHR